MPTVTHNLPASVGPIRFCATCPKMRIEDDGNGKLVALCRGGPEPVLVAIRVKNLDCPLGHFKAGLGDYLKRFLVKIGIDIPCTACELRRRMMNLRWGGMFNWMVDWKMVWHCPPCARRAHGV